MKNKLTRKTIVQADAFKKWLKTKKGKFCASGDFYDDICRKAYEWKLEQAFNAGRNAK